MTALFVFQVALVDNPVKLDRATAALEGHVAVPGVGRTAEGQQGTLVRRHFGAVILYIAGPAEQAETAAALFPGRDNPCAAVPAPRRG